MMFDDFMSKVAVPVVQALCVVFFASLLVGGTVAIWRAVL